MRDTREEDQVKNIVQLYFENKKRVPFIVRRENWLDVYGMLVTGVKPKKTQNGWFGDVFGYPLPPLDGSDVNPYWGETGKVQKLKNSGSYQWVLIAEVPENWKSFLESKKLDK